MTCDRLERDDLLGHLGEEMDPHVEQCHVCRATAYGYARLAAALAHESPRALPAGWKQRTIARIHAERTARRRRHAASMGISLASAAAMILIIAPRIGDPDRPRADRGELAVSVERGQGRRGHSGPIRAQPGDRLHASGPATAKHVELRLYRGSHDLVARCPGLPGLTCQQRGKAIELTWTFTAVGTYRAIWLTSPSPLPPPSGEVDADVLAAERAGARVMERGPIDVD